MRECADDFQKECEGMMAQLDIDTKRVAAGAEEIPLEDWLGEELYEEGLEADKREMDLVYRLRLRDAKPSELEAYTPEQRAKCLEMRMAHTRKRATPEQLDNGQPGSLKSRFVAKDLKVWNKMEAAETHADVPGMIAFRLSCARANLKRRRISSTDYDVAFMQSFSFKDFGMTEILVRWYDYREQCWRYGFLEGPTYGMQVAMKLWKITHEQNLFKLGFREAYNQKAVYWHEKLDILMICHVDDPWIDVGLGEEHCHITDQEEVDRLLAIKEEEIHAALSERFKTKGIRRLAIGEPIDYLSMLIQTDDGHGLYINKRIEAAMYILLHRNIRAS